MPNWYTEAEAAVYLKVPEEALKLARYRKKVKARKLCRVVQYKQEWLDEFREGKCEDNQNLSDEKIVLFGSSTSHRAMDEDKAALVRAKAIIARQNGSSPNGSSNGKSRNSRH